MSTYALINTSTGLVESIVVWDGSSDWSPSDGYLAVESDQAAIGWTYTDGVLSPPLPVPPTPEEILAANTAAQAYMLSEASKAMTPLLLSLQLGDATAEETASARAWQAYYRKLQVVDLTAEFPAWPVAPLI